MKRKHLAFFIAFPVGFLLLLAFTIFYFDLANGPLAVFILALLNLVALAVLSILFLNKRILFRLFPWFGFIIMSSILLSFAKPAVIEKSAAYYSNPVTVSEPLKLKNGEVKGLYNKDQDVEIYAGIPYAKARYFLF